MNKVRVNEGKVYEVTYNIKGDQTKNTVNVHGAKVRTIYSYYVYAVNENHARKIVESYDENAEVVEVIEVYDCVSQHYGD